MLPSTAESPRQMQGRDSRVQSRTESYAGSIRLAQRGDTQRAHLLTVETVVSCQSSGSSRVQRTRATGDGIRDMSVASGKVLVAEFVSETSIPLSKLTMKHPALSSCEPPFLVCSLCIRT